MDEIIEKLEELGLEDVADKLSNAILNVDNFKRELERQDLLSEKLKQFKENYIRRDNN